MPADVAPVFSDGYSEVIVHLECGYSSTPNFSETDDLCSVCAPDKMIAPNSLSWIEEENAMTGLRVNRINSCPLKLIAHFASQTQIIFFVRPSARDWDEMIYLKGAIDEVLSAQTVFAAITRSLLNTLSDFGKKYSS